MQAKTPLIVTPPQVKVQNHHLEIRPFTVQTIEHELPVASVAFVSTKVPVSVRQKAGAVDVPKRGTYSSGFTAAK
jgi:hypothetical protein